METLKLYPAWSTTTLKPLNFKENNYCVSLIKTELFKQIRPKSYEIKPLKTGQAYNLQVYARFF